jgi:hypothetical protein
MKKLISYLLVYFIFTNAFAQNVGIGTNSPDSSALLELNSSNKGFLPPRITTSQRNAITHPAEGLQIFNTTTHCLEMFVYGRWQNVFCGVADIVTITNPSLSTDSISSITTSSATCGGNITNDGGGNITARGVCWSTTNNPTIDLTTKTNDGTGTGLFTSSITGLTPNTTYYVRSYATNGAGTSYGNEVSFTTNSLQIGQLHSGGLVFYIDISGQHGLVCAPTEQPRAIWGCYGTNLGTQANFGTGANNTSIILSRCSQTNTAAYLCDTLTLNGYEDWYLPSQNELILMWQNLHMYGMGNFHNDFYLSSSELDNNTALGVYFNCCGATSLKYHDNWVRAIRAF